MTPTDPLAAGAAAKGQRLLLSSLTAAACLALMAWMGIGWDALARTDSYKGNKADYYSLLVHGFLKGHAYMDVQADPRLGSPDPAVRDKAVYMLDASYYRGHYYVYFGVTPAVLVLLPYRALTGGDLDLRFVVVLFSGAGFLFALALWRRVVREHLGVVGGWPQAAATLVIAFATAVPLLLTRSMFYEVPIATGYACTMAGALCLYRSLFGSRHPVAHLALASLAFGLAVGCRPELVFDVPLLAVAAFLAVRWGRISAPRALGRAALAAVVPAALVGLALAAYNYERFGSPTDFGINHSTNDFIWNHHKLASAAYLWPNLHWYFLTPPALSPYFPYVFPEEAYFGPAGYAWGEAIHGQFPVFVLAAFVGLSAIVLRRRLALGKLTAFLGFLGWMFLAAFVPLCAMGVRADRYMVDFQPALVLAVALLAAAVSAGVGGRGARLWRTAFGLLAAAAVLFNLFAGIEEFSAMKNTRKASYDPLEWYGNYPSYWLERMGLLRTGPIEVKVVFPEKVPGPSVEPILTVGTPENTDAVFASLWTNGLVQLSGDHHGYGGPSTPQMKVVPGREYTLRVDMGAFYPPPHHPYYSRFSAVQAHLIKSRFRVEMDGVTVLNRKMNSYDAPPWTLELGRNDITLTPCKTAFTGTVTGLRLLPPPTPEVAAPSHGLWRLRCVFPEIPNSNHPLLATGVAGNGTLIYLSNLGNNQVRLGLDEWGAGGTQSEVITADPGTDHVFEFFIGPAATTDAAWLGQNDVKASEFGGRVNDLRVWLDGRMVWAAQLHLPFDPEGNHTDVGINPQGFSTAAAEYGGEILSEPFSAPEAKEFLRRNTR